MRARVDFARRRITTSVRALTTEPDRTGVGAGAARALLGTEAHVEHAGRRRETLGPAYASEVSVVLHEEVDGFTAEVRGRLDGLVDEGERLVVEEVKSRLELGREAPGRTAEAAMQARLYALAIARAHPHRTVAARVVLVSLLDRGAQEVIEVAFDAARTREELLALLRLALDGARAHRSRGELRARCAEALAFPYPHPRPHQEELMECFREALGASRPVVASAPTGIGKTMAAMLPSLRFALERDATLVFLTAKNTQQAHVAGTFSDLIAPSALLRSSLRAHTLRAREHMCPPGHLKCHPEHCTLLHGFDRRAEEAGAVEALVGRGGHCDPDEVFAFGVRTELCPFELSRRVASEVELVIGDFNYVFDGSLIAQLPAAGPSQRAAVVVVDEAHNLFDRARGYFSPAIDRRDVRAIAEAVGTGELGDVLRSLGRAVDELLSDAIAEAEEETLRAFDGQAPATLPAPRWRAVGREAATALVRYAAHQRHHGTSTRDPVTDALRRLLQLCELAASDEPELRGVVDAPLPGSPRPRQRGVRVVCVDPARRLEEMHRRVLGTVAMSATLSPLAYYRDVLGLGRLDPVLTSAPDPFPREHRTVCIVPTVSTTFRQRSADAPAVAELIERIIAVRPGNYAAYFPSFAYLAEVKDQLTLPRADVLVQLPHTPPALRQRLLQRLRTPGSASLLLAVMGGVFAEGIDLRGDALSGAIVVGPALPPLTFERELMRAYFDDRYEQGYAYAMIFPGLQRVIQAAGRVIRTEEDRGVIVLLGRRFAEPAYLECLPEHWYGYEPRELLTDDPVPRLQDFWAASAPALDRG